MTLAQKTYDILDSGMRYVGAHRLRPGQKQIICTEAEAKFYIEGGALRPAEQEPNTPRRISAATATPAPQDPEREAPEVAPVAGDLTASVETGGPKSRKVR